MIILIKKKSTLSKNNEKFNHGKAYIIERQWWFQSSNGLHNQKIMLMQTIKWLALSKDNDNFNQEKAFIIKRQW